MPFTFDFTGDIFDMDMPATTKVSDAKKLVADKIKWNSHCLLFLNEDGILKDHKTLGDYDGEKMIAILRDCNCGC